jgi:hypothetical protein
MRAAGVLCAIGAVLVAGVGLVSVKAGNEPARISIDYPLNGSVFPPDMAAPTFLWRDPAAAADSWQIDIAFASGSAPMHLQSKGERMQVGDIDKRCISNTNKLPELPNRPPRTPGSPMPQPGLRSRSNPARAQSPSRFTAWPALPPSRRARRSSAFPPTPLARPSSIAMCR